MSLQDSLFAEEVENDVTLFLQRKVTKSNPKLNGSPLTIVSEPSSRMGVEDRRSASASPENNRQRQVKSTPAAQIYRPPAARRAQNGTSSAGTTSEATVTAKTGRQRRPDRAVYVPKQRRSREVEGSPQPADEIRVRKSKSDRQSVKSKSEVINLMETPQKPQAVVECPVAEEFRCKNAEFSEKIDELHMETDKCQNHLDELPNKVKEIQNQSEKVVEKSKESLSEIANDSQTSQISENENESKNILQTSDNNGHSQMEVNDIVDVKNITLEVPQMNKNSEVINDKKEEPTNRSSVSQILVISTSESSPTKKIVDEEVAVVRTPEKKPKKVARAKSKPASPPSPAIKLNRDECDWDSLFDDNGECLDPTLIEELTAAVGQVQIEQPKNDYKAYTRPVEISNDEYAHVIEIYNFPSEFKTSDLAAVFSPFKNGGFELKWVDDTHCLGVFSSPLVAAEVLASDHPFVKTRPLSEATQLSKTKARKSAEFLQPYRTRPETCAALARRLVTGALGVRLATARQEREHEKIVLRQAKERKKLANKQRDDAWEGIITPK